jgi:hypothetical protein
VTDPSLGTVDIDENGTFVYTSTTGDVGDVDTFSYRVVDSTGRPSQVVTVSFTLNQSRYQNPLADLSEDVNADGEISAIDALRIINFLSRELIDDTAISVPVSDIGEPPPDFYDANGDGRVSSGDALQVINKIRQLRSGLEGESLASPAALAVTTSFAAGSTAGLPMRNLEPVWAIDEQADPLDVVLASGFEISSPATQKAVDAVSVKESSELTTPDSVDQALSLVLDEFTLDPQLE